MTVEIICADAIEGLARFPDGHFDAVVTDPPYGLEFMGKEWDRLKPSSARIRPPNQRDLDRGQEQDGLTARLRNKPEAYVAGSSVQAWHQAWAAAALRVLKPGGHLVAFGGTRTHHRLWCALEDAGFEIRDTLMWLYGSGFPKSLDVSKAIDKAAGAEREVVGIDKGIARKDGRQGASLGQQQGQTGAITAPATDAARQWDGWGTALKPAWEPIVLARKPLAGTVAANVQAHGTGALNVDGCRVEGSDGSGHWSGDDGSDATSRPGYEGGFTKGGVKAAGRWPANVVLDEDAAAMLDAQSGERASSGGAAFETSGYMGGLEKTQQDRRNLGRGDSGGASRFFYVAKASRAERGKGNKHPTVKPLALMRWLVRLVTPPGGLILDPFVGSGTTAVAAITEGFRCVGIDSNPEYCEMARHRTAQRGLMAEAAS